MYPVTLTAREVETLILALKYWRYHRRGETRRHDRLLTPEEVVGHLALKTPDMQATACAHHEKILGGDLYGQHIPLDGRIPRDFGKVVELDGKRGIYFEKTPEEEALERWYNREFLDVERQIAKQWRRNLCGLDHEHSYSFFQNCGL